MIIKERLKDQDKREKHKSHIQISLTKLIFIHKKIHLYDRVTYFKYN